LEKKDYKGAMTEIDKALEEDPKNVQL